ncbi:MAG: DMT family transporter [Pseudomonadota bacterium]
MTPAPTLSPKTWALLLLLSLIWGGSFLFARIAVLEVPPITLVFARVALAALALNLFLLMRPPNLSHGGRWRDFALMGLLNNIIPFGLIFYGQLEIGAGLAAIINAMTPVWSLLFAHWRTADEKLSAAKLFGIGIGFAGVATLIGSAAFAGLQASAIAQLAVLGATISYGAASVFGKRFASVPPLITSRGQLTMSTLIIAPLALLIDRPWTLSMPSDAALLSIIALALVCTAYAYILFFRILALAGAVNVSLVTFLVPVSAVLLGILVLGETLAMNQIIGTGLILLGLAVIDGRLLPRVIGSRSTASD